MKEEKSDQSKKWFAYFILILILTVSISLNVFAMVYIYNEKAGQEQEKQEQANRVIKVVSITPKGKISNSSYSKIKVEFDRPVSSDVLTNEPLTIIPELDGEYSLDSPDTLIFTPLKKYSKATEYQIIVNAKSIRGIDKSHMEGDKRCVFSTPALSIKEISQVSFHNKHAIVEIQFSDRVIPEKLKNYIDIRYPDNSFVGYRLGSRVPSKKIQLVFSRLKYNNFDITVKPGLTGVSGPLPLLQKFEKKMVFTRSLVLTSIYPYMSSYSENEIVMAFNNSVSTHNLKNYILIEPSVDFTLSNSYSYSRIYLKGNFLPNTKYKVTLRKGFGSSIMTGLEGDITRSVWFGDMGKSLDFPGGAHYFSSKQKIQIPVKTVNLKKFKLSVRKLYPNNLVYYINNGAKENLSKSIVEKEVVVKYKRNEKVETILDLGKIAGINEGVFLLEGDYATSKYYWEKSRYVAVVSDIGISLRLSENEAFVWVTSLKKGLPVQNAKATLYSYTNQKIGFATTDDKGIARVKINDTKEEPSVIIVEKGKSFSYVSCKDKIDRGDVHKGSPYVVNGYEGFTFTERGIYRPGDNVKISLIVRDKTCSSPGSMPVKLIVKRPGDKVFVEETLVIEKEGTAYKSIKIPSSMPLGFYTINWQIPGQEKNIAATKFRVEEYIPTSIKISSHAKPGRASALQGFDFTTKARYLFGKIAKNKKVVARIKYTSVPFTHKDWKNYIFKSDHNPFEEDHKIEGKTDLNGECRLTVSACKKKSFGTIKANVDIEVQEDGGRPVFTSISKFMDPYPFYLGAHKEKHYIGKQKETKVKIAAVTPLGKIFDKPVIVDLTFERLVYNNVLTQDHNGAFYFESNEEVFVEKKYSIILKNGQKTVSISPKYTGKYRLKLDCKEGNSTVLNFYSEGGTQDSGWSLENPDELKITLDKDEYKIGEIAKVHIRSPFKGQMLLTVEKENVIDSKIIDVKSNKTIVEIPVNANLRPNAYICATIIRPVTHEKKWAPHRANGSVRIDLNNDDRKLKCEVITRKSIEPGKKWNVTVKVSGEKYFFEGKVLLTAVDEGILRLSGYTQPDIWKFFYRTRSLSINESDMYDSLAPLLSAWIAKDKVKAGGGDFKEVKSYGNTLSRQLNPIDVKRVKTAVLYSGFINTNKDGMANFEFEIPNYIGEFRVMAFAIKGNQFGNSKVSIPVKTDIMFKEVIPRFMAPLDKAELPVTIFNESIKRQDIKLNGKCSGPLMLKTNLPITVTLEAGEVKTVPVKVVADKKFGKASILFSVKAGKHYYEKITEFAVRPPVGFVRSNELVTLKKGDAYTLAKDTNYFPGTATTDVIIGSHNLVKLVPMLQNLARYPYGCVEQTTSKLFPLLYLNDIANLIDNQLVGNQEVSYFIKAGISKLKSMQTYSGGLGYWRSDNKPYYYGSAYAADFLTEAKKAGYEVDNNFFDSLLDYLSNALKTNISDRNYGSAAYACYVLTKNDRIPRTWITHLSELYDQSQHNISDDSGKFYLSLSLNIAGLKAEAQQQLNKTEAYETTLSRSLGGYLSSPTRRKAIMLMTYLDLIPDSPEILQLSNTLISYLHKAPDYTTQEKAFVLMALGKFFRMKKAPSPDLKAVITLPDNKTKIVKAFETFKVNNIKEQQNLNISLKQGDNLFVNIIKGGIPLSETVREQSNGIVVQRKFIALKYEKEVKDFKFHQGDLYRVAIFIETKSRIEGITIADLLPAGFELEKTYNTPNDKDNPIQDVYDLTLGRLPRVVRVRKRPLIRKLNPEHIESRDDRILAFKMGKLKGRYKFTYVVRAVTKGEFVLPATQVDCMYDPSILSFSGGGKITVE